LLFSLAARTLRHENMARTGQPMSTLGTEQEFSFTIFGEPASKANSRKAVMFGKRPAFIKSDKARGYAAAFQMQCPKLPVPLTTPLALEIHIWYASRRPDLDESLILDAMQGLIYVNDRQVQERHTYWGLDRANPRATITIRTIPDRGSHPHPGHHGSGQQGHEAPRRRRKVAQQSRL
jgi:Holliday junction resolvase RusA-like endonuclease